MSALRLAGRCLAQRLRAHSNYGMAEHWYWRSFYAAKAAICVLLGRERPREPWVWGQPDRHEHVDSVAQWDFQRGYHPDVWGAYITWTTLEVGYGFWRNWHVHIDWDANA